MKPVNIELEFPKGEKDGQATNSVASASFSFFSAQPAQESEVKDSGSAETEPAE